MNEAADKMLKAAGIKTPAERAAADKPWFSWGKKEEDSKAAGNTGTSASSTPAYGRAPNVGG
jgi:hypothetical protein